MAADGGGGSGDGGNDDWLADKDGGCASRQNSTRINPATTNTRYDPISFSTVVGAQLTNTSTTNIHADAETEPLRKFQQAEKYSTFAFAIGKKEVSERQS